MGIGMVRGGSSRLRSSLPADHPVRTMIEEHDEILGFLGELSDLNKRIQGMDAIDPKSGEIASLHRLAENLLSAENHHKREEDALFPELERMGITGPPSVMRYEHDELRARKRKLRELAEKAGAMDRATFKREVDETSRFIVDTLGAHIFKENNILYPAALQHITSEAEWAKIKSKCDRIGYCPFTILHPRLRLGR